MKFFDWQQHNRQLIQGRAWLIVTLLTAAMLLLNWTWRSFSPPAVQAQSADRQATPLMATPGRLAVELATTSFKPGQRSAVTATLRDSGGQPVVGELVVFFGGLGTITPASAVTDAEGRVNAIYTAGSRGGKAQVTVLAGYRAQAVPLQIESSGSQPGGEYRLFLPAVAR